MVWTGSSGDDQCSATHLLQSLGRVFVAGVDVVGSAKLHGKLFLVGAARECDSAVAHLAGVLDSKMAKTSKTLNGDRLAGGDVHLADTVVYSDTGAQERRQLHCVIVGGKSDSSLGLEETVLGIYTGR